MSARETARFLAEFVRKPRVIGAVSPSSRGLARRMVEWIDWPRVKAVVEYGPGTGVFTERILAQVRPGTRLITIEINPKFAALIRHRYPGVPVHEASVEDVGAICREEGVPQVDAIVSGLPWASFSGDYQDRLLRATASVLRSGGQFVTFAYLQGLALRSGRRFRRQLGGYFRQVVTSRTVWWNMPPAFVYRCRR